MDLGSLNKLLIFSCILFLLGSDGSLPDNPVANACYVHVFYPPEPNTSLYWTHSVSKETEQVRFNERDLSCNCTCESEPIGENITRINCSCLCGTITCLADCTLKDNGTQSCDIECDDDSCTMDCTCREQPNSNVSCECDYNCDSNNTFQGEMEWIPAECGTQITKETVMNICNALKHRGYNTKNLLKSINKYQENNGLPIKPYLDRFTILFILKGT